jgi:hypothetical protein
VDGLARMLASLQFVRHSFQRSQTEGMEMPLGSLRAVWATEYNALKVRVGAVQHRRSSWPSQVSSPPISARP